MQVAIPKEKSLLNFVENTDAEFFQDTLGDSYVHVTIDKHREVMPLKSGQCHTWLSGLYYEKEKCSVSKGIKNQVISVLEYKAKANTSTPVELHTRIAAEHNGAYWYDLTNSAWEAVEVTKKGWCIKQPPRLFLRYSIQHAQDTPKKGGDIRKILNYTPIKGNEILFLSWLVSCFVPKIPHPAMVFYGEKGAGKTTVNELLKAIIDPSNLETLNLSNDLRSLNVQLKQNHFLPYDNISKINDQTSDALCRAITGSGIQQRKLYTDDEEKIYRYMRCISINGVENVINRPDLLDRSILLQLERISDEKRKAIVDLKAEFMAERPVIMGGIFDTLSKAMKLYKNVKLDKPPRMADFERWGYAIAEAIEQGAGQKFLNEYAANRELQNIEAIDSDPLATLVVEFTKEKGEWTGKVFDLCVELIRIAPRQYIALNPKNFSEKPNQLSRRLNGIKGNLEAAGVRYENHGHGRDGTTVTLRWIKAQEGVMPND